MPGGDGPADARNVYRDYFTRSMGELKAVRR
jgi:hypothetical protein